MPATIGNGTINNRQEDGQVCRNCYVADLIALLIVEAQDDKLAEVEPAVVVVAEPVVNHPINCSAQVQLMVSKGIELNLEVKGLRGLKV
jgi:hypothetical protein